MRYKTKPFEIEAVQVKSYEDVDVARKAFPDAKIGVENRPGGDIHVYDYLQNTWVLVNLGDYIIKGSKGEYYPCDPEVFENKYEAVENA